MTDRLFTADLLHKYLLRNITILILFSLLFSSISDVYSKEKIIPQVMIINQIRGEECCGKGNVDHTKKQIDSLIKLKIPGYFVLRYDAIHDDNYISLFKSAQLSHPDLIHVGILLEVTPALAKASEVTYTTSEKWYEAQNAYTIGYIKEDKLALINTLFSDFYAEFNYYPELTSSWMIDNISLEYIHDNYHVKLHQITKEQYGTDSYTLYGGPPHYPYPASASWPLIPNYNRSNPPFIVRQTVTDPLYNYGDTTTSFTSQPNDYMHDGKDIHYFKQLINQALFAQNQQGFILLGLENAMNLEYQTEYIKQLEFVADLKENNIVSFPSIDEVVTTWSENKLNLYFGRDLINGTDNEAYWITTPNYRMRLRKKGDAVFVNDIRLFDISFNDPYASQIANKEGFWIVPYLIDGSHSYDQNQALDEKLITARSDYYPQTVNDFSVLTSRISFPKIKNGGKINTSVDRDSITISYIDNDGELIEILFESQSVQINAKNIDDIPFKNLLKEDHPIATENGKNTYNLHWNIDNKVGNKLTAYCEDYSCTISFQTKPELLEQMRIEQYPYLFPEPFERKVDKTKTQIFLHNQYAIAGRNPARIVLIPYNKYDIPISLSKSLIITSDSDTISSDYNLNDKTYFIDFTSSNPQSARIYVKLDDDIELSETVYFAPNCKEEFFQCITNLKYSWWYINSYIRDKIRLYIDEEYQ